MAETPGHGNRDRLPPQLAELLSARDEASLNRAWDAFLEAYSKLLLHTARSTVGSRDAAMDGYAYVLEKLREDDSRRLRAYGAGGRAKFTTWLVVVTRRLVLDNWRSRYGRDRSENPGEGRAQLEARRRLADLVSDVADIGDLSDPVTTDHGRALREEQRRRALVAALADLDPPDQLLLTLRFVDGLAGREIAELLGLPSPFHAYRRLNSILARLRTRLESHGIDDAEL